MIMTLEARDKLMSLTDVLAGPLGRSPAPMYGLHLDDAALEPNQSHRPSTGRSHLTHRPNMGQGRLLTQGANTTPMASSRMLDAFVRCSRIHTAASCRNVRILVYVITSRGWPKPQPTATLHLAEDQRQPGRAHPRHTQTKMITQPGHRHE